MKKNLLLLLSVIFCSAIYAQTYPFIDDFETYPDFTTLGTQGGYMSDMSVYSTHGFANSKGLIAAINQFNHSDSTVSPLVGPVTLTSEVSFYYRICDALLYPATATPLMSGDKIEIYGGSQQLGAYQLLGTINLSNHMTSTSFIKKTYALPAVFAGNPGNIKIKVTRGNASSIDCFFDFDSLVVKDATPVAAPLTVTLTHQDEQCFGANDGCVYAHVNGGSPPYTYLWSNFTNDSSICNSSPGIYCVQVTDANSQTASKCDTVLAATEITDTATVTDVACNGNCSGEITLTVTGGSGGYSYLWSNVITANPATNLCAGFYSVTITDSHGCSITSTYAVTQPYSIHVSAQIYTDSCYGSCSSSIIPSITGGTPPYNVLWSSGSNTNLCGGSYSVTITDANTCELHTSYFIFVPSELIVNFSSTNTTTIGGNDGTISYIAFGGTSPYYILVKSILGGQIQNEHQLSAGCYSVAVFDHHSCNQVDTICITDPTGISVLENRMFRVYPNPASDLVTIKTNEAMNAEVSLINSIGEIVKREIFVGNEIRLDVRSIAQGNYLLQLKTSEGISRKNISVVK